MKYDLTSNFLDLRLLVELLYIYKCKAILDFTYMGLKLTSQGRWVHGLACYDSLREELLVLNARAVFCFFVFFCLNDSSKGKKISQMRAVHYCNFCLLPPPH